MHNISVISAYFLLASMCLLASVLISPYSDQLMVKLWKQAKTISGARLSTFYIRPTVE